MYNPKITIMKKYKSLVLTVIGLLCSISVSAHDFEVDGIYYNITSSTDKTVTVTYQGTSYNYSDEYQGSVIIPETITYNDVNSSVISIAGEAFKGCSGVTSVNIPNSVTEIGYSAFENCNSLASISIGSNVTSFGGYAFYGTAWYKEQPNGIVYLDNYLVDYKGKGSISANTSITIKEGTLVIADGAFSRCSNLTSIIIPNSVTHIGKNSFSECSGLNSITIPNGVTSIEMYAFSSCKGLNSVTIPHSVTKIGEQAFSYCDYLTSVSIGAGVTNIGNKAFYSCNLLTSVFSYIPAEKLFSIGKDVFSDAVKTTCTLNVPYGAKQAYSEKEGWSGFKEIIEMEKFCLSVSQVGYASLYVDKTVKIPEGVKVYVANEVENGFVTLQEVTEVIPAYTAVVIKAAEGCYELEIVETTESPIDSNLFEGTTVDTWITPSTGTVAFVLSSVDGEVGMYPAKLTDGRFLNNANKAYLLLDNNKLGLSDEELDTSIGGAQLSLRFEFGDATSVDKVLAETSVNHATYDLYGRKVNKITTPGLYIVNGKKMWVK